MTFALQQQNLGVLASENLLDLVLLCLFLPPLSFLPLSVVGRHKCCSGTLEWTFAWSSPKLLAGSYVPINWHTRSFSRVAKDAMASREKELTLSWLWFSWYTNTRLKIDVESMDWGRARDCVDRSRDQYGHWFSISEVAWPNGKASDYESEDSGFDPQRDQSFCLL